MNTQSLQNTQVGAVIYITKEISDFQGDLTSWVLKAFVYVLSRFQLFETPWTVARQTPLSVGILQAGIMEWVAIPPPPGDLPNPEIEPRSPTLQVDSLPSELPGKPKNNGVVASPEDLPNPGVNPESPALQMDSVSVELPGKSADRWSDKQKFKEGWDSGRWDGVSTGRGYMCIYNWFTLL